MIDPTKKYRTKAGYQVRILCVDCKNRYFPVIALVKNRDDEEEREIYY